MLSRTVTGSPGDHRPTDGLPGSCRAASGERPGHTITAGNPQAALGNQPPSRVCPRSPKTSPAKPAVISERLHGNPGRAGLSVAVLLKVYFHCIDGQADTVKNASLMPSAARMSPMSERHGGARAVPGHASHRSSIHPRARG